MLLYRLIILDERSGVTEVVPLELWSDDEAVICAATELCGERSAELWAGTRLVRRFNAPTEEQRRQHEEQAQERRRVNLPLP